MVDQRVAYWRCLREELCQARASCTAELRDFHLEQAGEYADRLAAIDAPQEIQHWGSSEYIDQALEDIGRDIKWTFPL